MTIEGQLTRIQIWNPTFRPEEETPIVAIWISLPEIPWHFSSKEFVTALLKPIGKVLYLDTTSIQKTRGGVAKHQRHPIHISTIKKRDEDYKIRKELENEKISKNKIDQEKKEYRDQAIKNNKEPTSTNGNIRQQPHTVTISNT
ncbi:hypothetical protein KY285_010404 [Solanum tuberosum]|nr:hypothetical protein KY285_010404 [Solanum tuberosum]